MQPPPNENRDAYDGHANYREGLGPKASGEMLRVCVRGLLAIATCIASTWLVYKFMSPESAASRIAGGLFAGLVGLIAGAFCYPWLNGSEPGKSRPWGPRDLIAAAFFVFAYTIPLHLQLDREERERQVRQERQRVEERERDQYHAQRREEGVAKIRRLGRFAEPGVLPPDFLVQDHGTAVKVIYRGEKGTVISLSRVLPDSDSPGGWKGCALWTGGVHGHGRYYGHFIDPGMSLSFSMYDGCVEEFRDAPLEFRVGEPTMEGEAGERAWWSSSAFAMPEGREAETMRRLAATRARPEQTPSQVRPATQGEPRGEAAENLVERVEETASANVRSVVKCRDGAGAIHYTHACPPGTTRVDAATE